MQIGTMAFVQLMTSPPAPHRPATARLRAEIFLVASSEALVTLFAEALLEHGVQGHFCVSGRGGRLVPILGDAPELISAENAAITISIGGSELPQLRVLLRRPDRSLSPDELTRVRGYAQLYAAQALVLREQADDVETGCGLSLRQRYVLGRRLVGLAPVDIAAESGLSVASVSAALDRAAERLGTPDSASAIALAARRGWLAVTSLENCWPSAENITYKTAKNG